jgi:ubiquinone/menaquinone biosynthesis C-methylase UbiE
MARQERWQLAGNAPEIYARELVPAIFGPWAPVLVDLADPMTGERVMDVACGTGVVTRNAAQRVGLGGTVIGIDVNPGMLAIARSQSAPQADYAPIEWHEASADALPAPDESCDIVYCQLGLQYFPDRAAALKEMRRVLAKNGRLALLVWRSIDYSPGFAALAEALDRHVSVAAGAVMRAPFVMEDTQEIQALVASAGFHDITISQRVGAVRFHSIDRMVQCQVAGSPLAGHVAQVDETKRADLLDAVNISLQKYVGSDGLSFPIAAHLVRAVR